MGNRKKWLANAFALLMVCTAFAGCGDDDNGSNNGGVPNIGGDIHVCVFDQQNTDEKYLKKAATATSKAQYYYSCTCGEMDTDFFVYENYSVEVLEGYTRYNVKTAAPVNTTIGYGAQIDTDNFMPWNNLTAEEEAMLEQRIADMNLQFTRIKFFPEYFERANDNDDPDSFDAEAAGVDFECAEMQALYKVLDICEKNGVKVDLSWYGCNTQFNSYDGKYTFSKTGNETDGYTYSGGTWLGYNYSETKWVTAPRVEEGFDGYAEYAENISVMLNHLINVKGYTCIYGLSVIQEMFHNSADNESNKYSEYVKCCEVIDARLKKDGLRDKIVWIGQTGQGTASVSGTVRYFEDDLKDTKHIFDVCGMPNYRWNNDGVASSLTYFRDIMALCKEENKDLIITEFCAGPHFGVQNSPFLDAVNKTDIDSYTAGMYIARFMIGTADNGVAALNHYILGDTYFNNGSVHTMGLWGYRDNGIYFDEETGEKTEYHVPVFAEGRVAWAAHPEYYFWGLICKYTDSGSEIYRIREDGQEKMKKDVMIVAFRMPSGAWSYMVVNSSTETKKIAIVNESEQKPKMLQKYVVTEESMPVDRAVTLPASTGSVSAANGVAHVELPPMSFTVLSNKA